MREAEDLGVSRCEGLGTAGSEKLRGPCVTYTGLSRSPIPHGVAQEVSTDARVPVPQDLWING